MNAGDVTEVNAANSALGARRPGQPRAVVAAHKISASISIGIASLAASATRKFTTHLPLT
jgi:hypothetical protein